MTTAVILRSIFRLPGAASACALLGAGLYFSTAPGAVAQTASEYDLRSAGPGGVSWVPDIQDQSNLSDCWTFATTTALDSYLIMNGYLPTSTTAPDMAISSWHLSAYNGAIENTLSDNSNYNGIQGGFTWMTTSYYTRGEGNWPIPGAKSDPGPNDITMMGGGPVLVSSNTLNAFPLKDVEDGKNLGSDLPPVEQTPAFTVTGAYYFDEQGSGRTTQAEQVTAVKAALQQYGALATYMYSGGYTLNGHDDSVFHYDSTLGYEYDYDPESQTSQISDHVVTIIGWDDNVVIPEGSGTETGAWIVQNSWGSWGGTVNKNDGTFYAPYNDPFIGNQGVTAYTAVAAGKYSPVVLQNELGPTLETGNQGTDSSSNPTGDIPTGMGIIDASRANKAESNLTATSQGTLIALGLTSIDAQADDQKEVVISIFGSFTIVDGVATPGVLLETQSFLFPQEGYTVFDLDTPIDLTLGEVIAIEVDYENSPVPYVWESSEDSGTDAPAGLTYFYDKVTGKWKDFADFSSSGDNDTYPGVFSVKGLLAAVPEPATVGLGVVALGVLSLAGRRRRKSL